MGIIQLKYGTGSAVPSSLQNGEFAINVDTNQLWYGSGSSPISKLRLSEIIADNYIISSSVTSYTFQTLSGSTNFGDDSADIHKRTGSLNISGALNLNGPVNAITVTGNINANGNIIGDDSTNITNINSIECDQIAADENNTTKIQLENTQIVSLVNDTDVFDVTETLFTHGVPVKFQSHITASGNISASGLNHVFGGNVTIIKSGSDGDAVLTLEADSGNDNEAANPYIHLKQDNGGISGQIGISGDDDQWPSGHTLTGTKGNSMIIGMTGSASGNNRQLYLAAGNSASLRVENDADIHMYGNLNVAKAITVADTDVVDYDITNANKLTFGRANRDSIFTGTSFNVQTNVTASGHISASGNLIAAAINSHDHSIGFWNGSKISLGYENNTPIQIGKLNNPTTIMGNITASGNITSLSNITTWGDISASGYLTADRLYLDASSGTYLHHSSGTSIGTNGTLTAGQNISAVGTILAGWHGSTTRIKILVSDFIPDDVGRPAMIDDSGSDRWLESHGTAKLFASIPIPTGFTATHVHIYGSATSAITVYEADINSKTVTSKGTGNIGTEIDITDVASDTTNYLFLELAQASGEEVYGGYVTITPS